MKTAIAIASAAFIGFGAPGIGYAQAAEAGSTTAANPLPAQDKAFVQAATMSSSTEIDASKLAASHSQDKDVKSFAHRMIVDHTKLTSQLKTAAPHGVAVPKDNSDQTVIESLKSLKGQAFDKSYIKQVALEGHEKAIEAFQQEVHNGQNADLKKAAQKALPTIKDHYRMAQQLASKKGISGP